MIKLIPVVGNDSRDFFCPFPGLCPARQGHFASAGDVRHLRPGSARYRMKMAYIPGEDRADPRRV